MHGPDLINALAIAALIATLPLATALTGVCIAKWSIYFIKLHRWGVAYNQQEDIDSD
jgi:hypothetical protein